MTTNSVLARPEPPAPPPPPPPGPSTRSAGWVGDLLLGIRLAVGGGRTSLARLVLGTIGIGLATAILLVSASVSHVISAESARESGAVPSSQRIAGVAPLDYVYGFTTYRGTDISGFYVRTTGPTSPVPPGLSRVPGPNEIVLSPALAQLLASPDGALLRPRFPQHVVGLIAPIGLTGPQDLTYYAGMTPDMLSPDQLPQEQAYRYGVDLSSPLSPLLQALVVIGVVALLVPILIMVSISSRIAGAQRDRRLAALRLVGAGARQVRRIAAAESLASAATGMVLGFAVFFAFRQFVPHMEVFGFSAFTADVSPAWPLVVLIVLLVPVLAVGSALIALRGTVIEPLGVVRGGKPVRRRLWWRVGLIVVGTGLLLLARDVRSDSREWTAMIIVGSGALLIGVPVLLPWLLERTVRAIRGGPVSWQLAVRRLQLDSGTPARVVGGVAVVLAGAIALESLTAAASAKLQLPVSHAEPGVYVVHADPDIADAVNAKLAHTSVVREVRTWTSVMMTPDLRNWQQNTTVVMIASCDTVQALFPVSRCRDGDVFAPSGELMVRPGTMMTAFDVNGQDDSPTVYGRWRVPDNLIPVTYQGANVMVTQSGALLITPGALRGVRMPSLRGGDSFVRIDPGVPDGIEYLRNAVAGYPMRAFVSTYGDTAALSVTQKTFLTIRNGMLVGSLFTLSLAGVSLLVLALEQVRERRRSLAMQSAAGVPRAVLARSLLWQVAVPVGIGVVAAVATGIGLAWLVLRMTHTRMVLDWPDIGVFSGAAVALVLLVTAATLPALRNATRLSALRTE